MGHSLAGATEGATTDARESKLIPRDPRVPKGCLELPGYGDIRIVVIESNQPVGKLFVKGFRSGSGGEERKHCPTDRLAPKGSGS